MEHREEHEDKERQAQDGRMAKTAGEQEDVFILK